MNEHFFYSERNLNLESDNSLMYNAGPIEISISGWKEEIKMSSKKKWKELLEESLIIAKEAWEIENNQIFFEENNEKNTIIIKYNFKNLKLYIEHAIVFM
jgi:hypothetical protein